LGNSCWEKNGKNNENSRKKCKQQKKLAKNLKSQISKEKLVLMSKCFKLILIIPTLKTSTIPTSNLFENFKFNL